MTIDTLGPIYIGLYLIALLVILVGGNVRSFICRKHKDSVWLERMKRKRRMWT